MSASPVRRRGAPTLRLVGMALAAGVVAAWGCQFDTRAADYADSGNPPPPDGNNDAPPPDAPGDGPATTAPTDCPPDYVEVPGAPIGSKYKVRDSKKRWAEARNICAFEAEGNAVARTHLVALETPDEYDAIASLYDTEAQHLGLTKMNLEIEWQWVTGATADLELVPWAPGEPQGPASCAAIEENGGPQGSGDAMRVVAVPCTSDTKRRFVCECQDGVGDDLFD